MFRRTVPALGLAGGLLGAAPGAAQPPAGRPPAGAAAPATAYARDVGVFRGPDRAPPAPWRRQATASGARA